MEDNFICLQNIFAGYNGKSILSDVSFSVKKGEIISLVGPNGSGKSTLLKNIIRQLKPISGTIILNQKNINQYRNIDFAKTISVHLTHSIHPELMTCRDVVASGRYPFTNHLGFLSNSDNEHIEKMISLVHAEHIANSFFNNVSDGQKQRILFARALCQNPKILVLDEPTSYLDIKWKLELVSILRDIATCGTSIIMSIHEIDLAQKVSDRILCVNKNECSIMLPQEFEEENRIKTLYELKENEYNPLLGVCELPKIKGSPKVFVLSSCGTGIPIYRMLRRKKIPFATGILYKNDIDFYVANMLSDNVIDAEPFEPICDEKICVAKKLIDSCSEVINAGVKIGSCNKRMAELIKYSEGKLWQNQL